MTWIGWWIGISSRWRRVSRNSPGWTSNWECCAAAVQTVGQSSNAAYCGICRLLRFRAA